MSSNLYKLPKDILVKLVSEIQDMTEKKYEDLKIFKKYLDLYDWEVEIHRCNGSSLKSSILTETLKSSILIEPSFKKCENYITEGHNGTEGNCENITKCIICSLKFCNDHLDDHDICESCKSDPTAKLLKSGEGKQRKLDKNIRNKGCGISTTCDISFCCCICDSVKCYCENAVGRHADYICKTCSKDPKIEKIIENINYRGVSI